MRLPLRLSQTSLKYRRARQHVVLICLLALASLACAFADRNPLTARNRRFLLFDDVPQQGHTSPLRLKLERIPNSNTDKYETLRRAIWRDRTRRALQASSSSLYNASLNVISGSSVGSGEYFASLSIGTPPQKLFLIADTGSDISWVKCSTGPPTPPPPPATTTNQSFDESASSTFSPISCFSTECYTWFSFSSCALEGTTRLCGFSFSYTDKSSVAGWLAYENVTFGETANFRMVMGCAQQYAGANFEKAGGVVGLGQGALSFASQLANKSTYFDKFSYCLADFLGPSSVSGSLVFGESLSEPAFNYTPFIQNPSAESFYYVGVEEVMVGGIPLAIRDSIWAISESGDGGTVVDSGTTLAQFQQPAYVAIRDAFQQAIEGISLAGPASIPPGLDLCYMTTAASLASMANFPKFSIVFDGGLLFEPPTPNYFTEAAPGITCLAMQPVALGSFSVIGNLLQQNFYMEFDRLNKQLGIAPADCSKLHA